MTSMSFWTKSTTDMITTWSICTGTCMSTIMSTIMTIITIMITITTMTIITIMTTIMTTTMTIITIMTTIMTMTTIITIITTPGALRIFEILAQAESEAHGVPVEEVHFHEVGAIDSIVDIVAAAVCLDDLDITKVAVTGITEGSGTVRCQHGILQVPVPAVERIARAHALPLHFTSRKGELVTPTGAAFAAAVMTQQELPEKFVIVKTGLGAGKREYEIPSILRAMILEPCGQKQQDVLADRIWKLECDMDDCTGEQLGYALGRLYDEGAREAHYAPVFMKKNRPGWELTVICDEAHREQLENVIFKETTTIGIRRQQMERSVLARKSVSVKTQYGEIPVKISGENEHRRVHPEYEMVSEAAQRYGVPFGTVYDEVLTKVMAAE